MNIKNLVFASASFHPNRKNFKYKKKDYIQREVDYLFCLKQLIRVSPANFEIYVVDNTVRNSSELFNQELISLLSEMNVLYSQKNTAVETKNIGVGELEELIYLSEKCDLKGFDKVAYFSARRFISNPYVFEKTQSLKKDALLSNPDFIYLNGEIVESEKKGMFNDMFFSMQSKTMQDYISFSRERLEYLEKNMVNSESNLYDFIHKFNISYEELSILGFFRYDYYRGKSKNEADKYHFI
jgi:hypothetical protein